MTGTTSDRKPVSPVVAEAPATPEKHVQEAIDFILDGVELTNISEVGKLRLPKDSDEDKRCQEIKRLLEEYAGRPEASKPFSIAVFGPPGSGKSFYVRQIIKCLKGKFGRPSVVNLSQLSSPRELAEVFKKRPLARPRTRIFFFDEFDASLGGHRWGWLHLFLAPMQDGEFFSEDKTISIGKAIFIFAGGTASSFDEFQKRTQIDPEEYRAKKVPDFISRLRGFIDIQGINSRKERSVRRALVLGRLLKERWPDKSKPKGGFPIDDKLVKGLLLNAHFVHGVRSMEALLEMSIWQGSDSFAKEHLPKDELKKLHISRGLLDDRIIGISAGQKDDDANEFLMKLAKELLNHGAILAYGGDFVADGTLHQVVQAAAQVPDDLVERREKRIRNYLGFPAFLRATVRQQRQELEKQVEFLELHTLSEPERRELEVPADGQFSARSNDPKQYNPKHHLAWAVSLFRMRARLIHDVSALIVIGGKDSDSWGRFSGIAEEVMLALALKKPVYVLGGRGGAADAIGKLLGLDQSLVNPDSYLADGSSIEPEIIPPNFKNAFTLPGHSNLPNTVTGIRSHLFERSVTTPRWPWNGLLLEENRELFRTRITKSDWGKCVDLIITGLMRLDWKLPSDPPRKKNTPAKKTAAS